MTADEELTAGLLFTDELASASVSHRDLYRPDVCNVIRERRELSPRTAPLERFAMKRGWLDYRSHWVLPFDQARRSVLGDNASGPPRLLVRVDEFPHASAWDEPTRYGPDAFRRFHEIMSNAGVPYLLADRRAFPDDTSTRRRARSGSSTTPRRLCWRSFVGSSQFRRTRLESPNPGSSSATEIGVARSRPGALNEFLDRVDRGLGGPWISPHAFRPSFDRFDARQYPLLAGRYTVVCGGPATVTVLGFRRSPVGLRGGVYLPSLFAPLRSSRDVLPAVKRRCRSRRRRLWIPSCCTGDGRPTTAGTT